MGFTSHNDIYIEKEAKQQNKTKQRNIQDTKSKKRK